MPTASESLRALLETKRVIIAVGAGGVGKTTTAAALAVAAAQRGRRVLCLTIDPAKRLAQSLGLDQMTREAVQIDPARFAARRRSAPREPDDHDARHEAHLRRPRPQALVDAREAPRRSSSNKLYQYVSTCLAGTQEYMAMEKLVAVQADPQLRPHHPRHAAHRERARLPRRARANWSTRSTPPPLRWFIEAFQSTGKLSLNLLARSAAVVLARPRQDHGRRLPRGDGGVHHRAERPVRRLPGARDDGRAGAPLGRGLVRAGDVAGADEHPGGALLLDRLVESHMPRGAFVVNRVRQPPTPLDGAADLDIGAAARFAGIAMDDDAPARLRQAHLDAIHLAALDERNLADLLGPRGRRDAHRPRPRAPDRRATTPSSCRISRPS